MEIFHFKSQVPKTEGKILRNLLSCLFLMFMFIGPCFGLKWETNTPAIFGQDVRLNCTFAIPRNGTPSSYQWYSDGLLALEEHIVSDKSKYGLVIQQRVWIVNYILIIKHFSKSDLKMNYTCSHGFRSHTKNLIKDLNSFEYHPTNDTTNKTVSIKDQVLNVKVQFREVFPVPRCNIYLKDINLTANVTMDVEEVGLFKRVSVTLIYKLKQCSGILHMICYVGSTELELINKDIYSVCNTIESPNYVVTIILSFICACVLAVLGIVLYVVFCYVRKRRIEARLKLTRKGQNGHNERNEQQEPLQKEQD